MENGTEIKIGPPSPGQIAFGIVPDGAPLPPECLSKSGKPHLFTRVITGPDGVVKKVLHNRPDQLLSHSCGTVSVEDLERVKAQGVVSSLPEAIPEKSDPDPDDQQALKRRYFVACLRFQRGTFDDYSQAQMIDVLGLLTVRQCDVASFDAWKKAVS